MSENQGPVYLEDLEAPKSQEKTEEDKVTSSQSSVATTLTENPVTSTSDTTTTTTTVEKAKTVAVSKGTKRQRTLMDMFTPVPATAQKSKKLKLDETGSGSNATTRSASMSMSSGSASGTQTLNSIPFSLSAYMNSLSDEERQLLTLECDTMGKSWLKVLKEEIRKPYFIKLKRFLWEEGVKTVNESAKSLRIYPAPGNIYSWSNLTPLGRVKVVIIGQDPYHGPGQAHGLSFSVPQGVPVPPSLRSIYTEIKAEYPAFEIPKHGNLTSWAENGVLLLNTSLTVKAGNAGSHQNKGWENFTDKVIEVVDKYGGANLSSNSGQGRGIVFLAWGAWAAKRVSKLDKPHKLLTDAGNFVPPHLIRLLCCDLGLASRKNTLFYQVLPVRPFPIFTFFILSFSLVP
ncbi:hypothetical protein QCA50_005701 [Cerrena zonata]|uniref:Uracil-DNA glycosylase-like domain-containing protein n=1 Tax=Cerrena zonata TaxID=2478898 RepID=A0AAW0GFX3_9APHY